jgi:hypothetical protein
VTPEEPELAEQAILELLIETVQEQKPPKVRRGRSSWRKPMPPTQPRPIRGKPRCKCGLCLKCVEEARWERIFQEKFADPDYYKPREPRQGSSLGWLKRVA